LRLSNGLSNLVHHSKQSRIGKWTHQFRSPLIGILNSMLTPMHQTLMWKLCWHKILSTNVINQLVTPLEFSIMPNEIIQLMNMKHWWWYNLAYISRLFIWETIFFSMWTIWHWSTWFINCKSWVQLLNDFYYS
jgi:hypothetical protein